jgi:hypothetical protein
MSQKGGRDKIEDLQLSSPGLKASLTPLSSKRQRVPSRKASEADSEPTWSSPPRKARLPRRKKPVEPESERIISSPPRNSQPSSDNKLVKPESESAESSPIRDSRRSRETRSVKANTHSANYNTEGQLIESEEITDLSSFNPFAPEWLAELDRIRAMADSNAPQSATAIGTDDDPTRGLPYHDRATQVLKAHLQKKRLLENAIVRHTLHDMILLANSVSANLR